MDITKLLPSLPEWISLPIILMVIIVTLWPKILLIIKDLNSSSRVHEREKQKLELLKIRYEIEAIRKENGLDEITQEETDEVIFEPDTELSEQQTLSAWLRFGYGVAGSLAPIMVNLLLVDFPPDSAIELSNANIAGITIRLLIFALLAGIGAAFLAKDHATKQTCFLVGLSISLLFSLLITANTAQHNVVPIENIS